MTIVDEAMLQALGIQTAGGNDREIKAYCPVHIHVKGHEASSPKWYMNRATGAWICFSCQQRGSLYSLVDIMGGDLSMIEEAIDASAVAKIHNKRVISAEDDDVVEEAAPEVYISEYAFSKFPYPHKAIRQLRDIRKDACAEYNVRWDPEGNCFLIPLYDVRTRTLIGWQEKAKGYFMNVPKGVDKKGCLFGYQQFFRGTMIVMESPLDVIRCASHGVHGGVAVMGSYTSKEQIEAMVAAADDDIILAFDNDEAGVIARDYVADTLKAQRLAKVRYFNYPGPAEKFGKDIGELEWSHVVEGLRTASSLLRSNAKRPAGPVKMTSSSDPRNRSTTWKSKSTTGRKSR